MIFIVFCVKYFHYIMTLPVESIFYNQESYHKLQNYIVQSNPSSVFVLVDEHTRVHCLPIFKNHFQHHFQLKEIPAGESFKNIETVQKIWQKLTDLGADRRSLLINLGGGVLTDMGGFVALTFKRGMKFINIPTTLLGMVDAAIGGKTGIDFNSLKNQIGIIAPPEMVLIDPEYLKTLSSREFLSGMAEVFKYGLIADETLWNNLIQFDGNHLDPHLIFTAAEIKKNVVLQDPFENGIRKSLNFGHTLGHAIETYFMSKSEESRLLHGEAIAVGMIMAVHLSTEILGFSLQITHEIKRVLLQYFKPIRLNESDIKSVLELLIHDKKNFKNQINFVLLRDFGDVVWDCQVTETQIRKAISYYLEY
jgi:3-dehydroquinate synthase